MRDKTIPFHKRSGIKRNATLPWMEVISELLYSTSEFPTFSWRTWRVMVFTAWIKTAPVKSHFFLTKCGTHSGSNKSVESVISNTERSGGTLETVECWRMKKQEWHTQNKSHLCCNPKKKKKPKPFMMHFKKQSLITLLSAVTLSGLALYVTTTGRTMSVSHVHNKTNTSVFFVSSHVTMKPLHSPSSSLLFSPHS